VFSNAVRNIDKIRNISILFHKNYIRYFVERYTYEAKYCDLDMSVEWFQLLFRKIKLTWILMRAILTAIFIFPARPEFPRPLKTKISHHHHHHVTRPCRSVAVSTISRHRGKFPPPSPVGNQWRRPTASPFPCHPSLAVKTQNSSYLPTCVVR